MTTYPPEPWYLGGELLVSAFRVPTKEVPHARLPDGRRPVRCGRHAIVGVAFVRYVAGGVLQYDELLVALPSLPGPRITIPLIWVDSPESRAGGRELWGIPKELADFTRSERPGRVQMSMGTTASIDASYGRRVLPGMTQLPLTTLQTLEGRRTVSRNYAVGRVCALEASWTFDPAGPLGFLAGRSPFFSAAIRDASIIFGMDVQR